MNPREDDITAWFREQRCLDPNVFPIGIGDDMAQVRLDSGASVLITTDVLLDGAHFDLAAATLEQVGYKAMAVSLSDCAAMATVPVAAVVAVALPAGFGAARLRELHAGIIRAADKYACPLIGGDITSWQGDGRLAVNVAMLSKPGVTAPVRRDGAKCGDAIVVTGALGGSVRQRHLEFEPRVQQALKLSRMATLNAMIDISDGLSTDLNRICRSSRVGAIVEAAAVPISHDAQTREDPLAAALHDGEDFELLFTLAAPQYDELMRTWEDPVPMARVGEIVAGDRLSLRMANGELVTLRPQGYDHLGKEPADDL